MKLPIILACFMLSLGTAGSLDAEHPVGGFILAPQALAEDGVAHLYLKKGSCAKADPTNSTCPLSLPRGQPALPPCGAFLLAKGKLRALGCVERLAA